MCSKSIGCRITPPPAHSLLVHKFQKASPQAHSDYHRNARPHAHSARKAPRCRAWKAFFHFPATVQPGFPESNGQRTARVPFWNRPYRRRRRRKNRCRRKTSEAAHRCFPTLHGVHLQRPRCDGILHRWPEDVIESVDGYFSGEKNGVIIQGATMSDLYEKCKSFDIASVMEKIKTGVELNDWEKRLIKVNKKLLSNQ